MRAINSWVFVGVVSVVGVLAACSGNSGEEAGRRGGEEPLAPPASGFQVTMEDVVAPAIETERCKFVRAPSDQGKLFVQSSDIRYTPGSHHVLLWRTPYEEIPQVDIHGRSVDTSGVFDCTEGPLADWSILSIVGGGQTPDARLLALPPGVALQIEPGEVLLIDAHYLNASEAPLRTRAWINLSTVPERTVSQEAGFLFFYDPYIYVPAGTESAPGRASARFRCPISRDIRLVNAQSHMHRRGVGYLANLVDAGGHKLAELYAGTAWSDPPMRTFEGEGLALPAGTAVDYRCDYKNPEARDVFQGGTTRDEMCMFLGAYYPRDAAMELCATPVGPGTLVSTGVPIGDGSATCGESLGCLSASTSEGAAFRCVTSGCEGDAVRLGDVLSCQNTAPLRDCLGACGGAAAGAPACDACVQAQCRPALDACQAGTCAAPL